LLFGYKGEKQNKKTSVTIQWRNWATSILSDQNEDHQ
jgi:hypothetical protein